MITPHHRRDYRPDIDGLRAVAVGLVIAFHYHLTLPETWQIWLGTHLHRPSGLVSLFAKGGYVGVDVFFVISGFLITGILLRSYQDGTASLRKFYRRRILRILPPLIPVLLFCGWIACINLMPHDLSKFAVSFLAAVFSWSNFYFLFHSGYFDGPAVSHPLVHTWSLSVEEQFYLVFPIVFLFALRRSRTFTRNLVLIAATLSLLLSGLLIPHVAADFYFPLTRAWELMAGSLMALGVIPLPKTRTIRNLVALAGLLLLLWCTFSFSAATHFPGFAALLPVLAAMALIGAQTHGPTLIGRVLSWPPIRWIGLISYSLYLWHWPLWVANRLEYVPGMHLSPWALLLLAVALAGISWRLIEMPSRRLRLPDRTVFALAAAGLGTLGLAAGTVLLMRGLPQRLTPEMQQIAAYEIGHGNWTDCYLPFPDGTLPSSCLAMQLHRKNYLLLGSSHAAHLWLGLARAYPQDDFLLAASSNCKPLLESMREGSSACQKIMRTAFEDFLPQHRVDGVILSSFWIEQDADGLGDTVSYLKRLGIPVYVVGPIPAYDQPLPRLLVRALWHNDVGLLARHGVALDPVYRERDNLIERTAMQHGAQRYISLRCLLCTTRSCLVYAAPGIPLQADENHLTDAGSLLVGRKLRDAGFLP